MAAASQLLFLSPSYFILITIIVKTNKFGVIMGGVRSPTWMTGAAPTRFHRDDVSHPQ